MVTQNVLVYGGNGALGRQIVKKFHLARWNVISVDFKENDEANKNITLHTGETLVVQGEKVMQSMKHTLREGERLQAVICVAGGWTSGNASDSKFLSGIQLMMDQSINSSVIAAHVAAYYLEEKGLLTLTGAKAALQGTSFMIGYGLAKAAVHHLTRSLAMENSGLPKDAKVVALLPVTLDTPVNREAMPKADFSKWTPLNVITEEVFSWATGSKPVLNGSLIEVITHQGHTTFQPVQNI